MRDREHSDFGSPGGRRASAVNDVNMAVVARSSRREYLRCIV